jgi:hypothetical protein
MERNRSMNSGALHERHMILPGLISICCILAALPCFGQSVSTDNEQEADNAVTGGIEVDFNSKYVWHGLIFTDEPVIQPSAWISAHNFTFSIWNNQTPGSKDGLGSGDEVDLSVAYERALGQFNTELAFAYYIYPNQEDSPSTGELSVRLSRGVGSFEFSTGHSLDVVEYGGAYFGDVQAMFERGIADGLSFQLATSLGWASAEFNDTYAGVNRDALNLLGGATSAYWNITDDLYLMPHLEVYRILNDAVAEAAQRDVLCIGAVVGIEF